MTPRERNYWLDTLTAPAVPPLPLPAKVDVAVVGAGFTGLSAARTLARRGARVAVVEAETIGWGASSRNGGMVLTGTKLGVKTLIARYGLEKSRQMYAASSAAIACVEQIVREEAVECDFGRCGHLEVACKASHFEGFARSAELLAREFNHTLRLVPRNELRSEVGSAVYFGGVLDETSAGVNPARYVAGLAHAALKAGAGLHEHTRVARIARAANGGQTGFQLATSRGALWAHDVIIATSGYTGPATPALQKRVIPIGSYIIVSERLPEALARELNPRGRMIFDSRNYLHYYRLTPDRRILFGGGGLFPRDREHHPAQRRDPPPRYGAGLSPVARREGGIRLGRDSRLHLRCHAARGEARRHVLRPRLRRTRRGHGHLPGHETRRDPLWRAG